MGDKVVIFGTSSFAEVAHFYLTQDSDHEVVAFTASGDNIQSSNWRGLPVEPFESIQETYPPDGFRVFVAVGYKRLSHVRERFFHEAKEKGYSLISYVSSRATHWGDTQIGENCFVFEDNTVQPFVTIGDNVIMWSGNHIGHHSTIGDHCFICSHAVISGHVKVGPNCFIGVNATIRDDVTIGPECIIGAGALILKNTAPREVYIGERTKKFPKDSRYF